MDLAQVVCDAIDNTAVAQVVKVQNGATRLHITHRVQPKKLKIWLAIVEHVLLRKQGWDAHVGKQYFVSSGQLRYAWNFIIQWQDEGEKEAVLKQVAGLLKRANNEAPRNMHQLESYPLAVKDASKRNTPEGPRNPRASGPMMGGARQRGAHKIGGQRR